jgi:hypothetical protein
VEDLQVYKLSFTGKRVLVGIVSLLPLFCVVNYFLDLHIFGQYDKKVLVASFIVAAIIANYFGPTFREVREYRYARRAQKH